MFIRRLHKKRTESQKRKRKPQTEGRNKRISTVLDAEISSSTSQHTSANVSSEDEIEEIQKHLSNKSDDKIIPKPSCNTGIRVTAHEVLLTSPSSLTCVAWQSVCLSTASRSEKANNISGSRNMWIGNKKGQVICVEVSDRGENSVGSSPLDTSNYLEKSLRFTIEKKTMSETHKRAVLCLSLSQPETGPQLAASGSVDGEIKIWCPCEYTLRNTLQFHRLAVAGLSFRTQANALYAVSVDRTLSVWDAEDAMHMDTLYGATSPLSAVASGKKDQCVCVGEDCIPRCFRTTTGKHSVFDAQQDAIESIGILSSCDIFVTGTVSGTLAAYKLSRMQQLPEVRTFAHGCENRGDGTGLEQYVPLHKLSTSPYSKHTFEVGNAISALCVLGKSSSIIVSGSSDGYIRFWRIKDDGVFDMSRDAHIHVGDGVVCDICSSEDGTVLGVICAKEPRTGRWNTFSNTVNTLHMFTLDVRGEEGMK